ncbi:unnamed protein product, partial [Chrysoparadoxa australica]
MKQRWKGPPTKKQEGESYDEFFDMLKDKQVSFSSGETVPGTVVQYDGQGALVDIGAKASAYLPLREAGLVPVDEIEGAVSLDDSRDFMVISEENENGQVTVSIRRLEFNSAWEAVQTMQANDDAFEAEVVAVNRGGAIVLVQGLRAFLPGSHLCGGIPDESLVGTTLSFKFLEVNPENNKLVVSNRRAVLEKEMKQLSRGDVV